MKLKEYLILKKQSIEDFSLELGLSYAAVRLYVNAGRVPTPKVMRKIIEITNGAVTPNDFYASDDRERRGITPEYPAGD